MTRRLRFLAALAASCCALLAFAALASAQETLYGADGARGNPSNLYRLDPSTGAVLQNIGPIGFQVSGLAVDPSTGTLYGSTGGNGSSEGSLITINKTTGAGTFVGAGFNDRGVPDITFTPDATLFGWWQGGGGLARFDKATGAGTFLGPSGLDSFGNGLASNAAGTLFLAGDGDDGPLRTVDPNTGLTTKGPTLDGTDGHPIAALAFDAAGTLFGARLLDFIVCCDFRPADLITIDTNSGAITSRGSSVDNLDAIAFDPPFPPAAPAGPAGPTGQRAAALKKCKKKHKKAVKKKKANGALTQSVKKKLNKKLKKCKKKANQLPV